MTRNTLIGKVEVIEMTELSSGLPEARVTLTLQAPDAGLLAQLVAHAQRTGRCWLSFDVSTVEGTAYAEAARARGNLGGPAS